MLNFLKIKWFSLLQLDEGRRKQNFSSNIDNRRRKFTDNVASLIQFTPARLQGGLKYLIKFFTRNVYYSELYCLRLHSIGLHHRLPIHPPVSVCISRKSIFVLSFNWILLFPDSLVTRDKPARFHVLVALLQHPVWLRGNFLFLERCEMKTRRFEWNMMSTARPAAFMFHNAQCNRW